MNTFYEHHKNSIKLAYRCSQGYSICLLFLKLFERIYSPLTAGLLQPYRPDTKLDPQKRTQFWTACIKKSSTISRSSFVPSASRPHDP